MARSVGVEDMWLEDCIQEIALEVWHSQSPHWKTVARYAAINFVRQYGRHRRNGVTRETRSIEEAAEDLPTEGSWTYHKEQRAIAIAIEDKTIHDPWPTVERTLDLPQALAQLSPAQRRNLFNRESGVNHDTLRYQARQRLRKLCA